MGNSPANHAFLFPAALLKLPLVPSLPVELLESGTFVFEGIGLFLPRLDSVGAIGFLLLQSVLLGCLPSPFPTLTVARPQERWFLHSTTILHVFQIPLTRITRPSRPGRPFQQLLVHPDVLDEVVATVGVSKGHDPTL